MEVFLKRLTLLAALVLAALTLTAQTTELDRAASAMSGMEAGFTHRFSAKGFKTSQVESGSVVFGTLPQMRWNYTTPEKKLFVFDGTQSWFYVPGDNQVTLGRVSDSRKAELPFLLLGNPSARDQHFSIKQQNRGGAVITTLQPRDARALVRNVVVTIAPSTHLIQRIEYTDREGNRTSFDFVGYHRRAASADLFRFDPPAGTQVIRAD
jgi:chaperone LolA